MEGVEGVCVGGEEGALAVGELMIDHSVVGISVHRSHLSQHASLYPDSLFKNGRLTNFLASPCHVIKWRSP